MTAMPPRVQLRFDQYTVDPIAGRLQNDQGQVIDLRPKSFEVLLFLAQHAGRLVAKEELFAAVWPNVIVTDDSLVQCVREVRRSIGDEEQQAIRTVPRRGYIFTRQVTKVEPAARIEGGLGTETATPYAPPTPDTAPAAMPRRWLTQRRLLLAVALLMVMGSLAWFSARYFWRGPYIDNPLFTLVVLPLGTMTKAISEEHLAANLTAQLTVEVARISSSFVIARNTADRYKGKSVDPRQVGRELGVRYVLQGSVARENNRALVSLELVDTETGQQVWTERFEGEGDGFVLEKIVRTLHLKLLDTEAYRASRERPTTPTVDDLAIRGHALIERQTAETIEQARQLALQATKLEPTVVYGWNTLAATYFIDLAHRWHLRYATREEWTKRGQEAAAKAYGLDPNNFYALGVWAFSLQTQGRFEEAIAAVERQIEMNRNYTVAFHRSALLKLFMGLADEALALEQQVLRTTPKNNLQPSAYGVMALALIHLGRDAEAMTAAQKAIELRPDFPNGHAHMAAAAASAGDLQRARVALDEFRRLIPNYTLRSFRNEAPSTRPAYVRGQERYYEGLRKAGLEE